MASSVTTSNAPASEPIAAPAKTVIVVADTRNTGLEIVLAVFFGPLGLFYSSILGGFVMLVVSSLSALFTLGMSIVIT